MFLRMDFLLFSRLKPWEMVAGVDVRGLSEGVSPEVLFHL